jgi:hypothetical protein
MRPKLWSGGDENALCCNSNLRNSSKNNLASAISPLCFFIPLQKRPRALYHPGSALLAPAAASYWGLCAASSRPLCAPCHTALGKSFFLFSKNNPIKLFPGGIALLISTHTLHQTSGARDEVVLINSLAAQSEMHFLVQITECKCSAGKKLVGIFPKNELEKQPADIH